jgi:hypothetical protein
MVHLHALLIHSVTITACFVETILKITSYLRGRTVRLVPFFKFKKSSRPWIEVMIDVTYLSVVALHADNPGTRMEFGGR